MKYIRTKDRIIDTSKYAIKREIYENGEPKFYEFWTDRSVDRRVIQLFAYDVIKQADTIEELCDEFVIYEKQFGEKTRYIHSCIDIPNSEYSDYKIYGAIWVKGEHNEPILKSVAKINENGELESL